jgi:N-carbamoyl-L-amino-acid hydrolase
MAIRRDAGVALTELCHRIHETFPEVAAERSVWTTGRITLQPGAPSIIPGRAEMLFQFRDADLAVLERMQAHLERLVAESNTAGPCSARLEVISRAIPAVMDGRVQDAIETAAEQIVPGRHTRMPSGAGHDAQNVARHLPSGMLFVPSIGGISHHWTENTSDQDIVAGGRVFAAAIGELLAAAE